MNETNMQKLYGNLLNANVGFNRTYDEFVSDMQDEEKRKRLHGNLSKAIPGFTRTYDEFSADMGLPMGVEQEQENESRQSWIGRKAENVWNATKSGLLRVGKQIMNLNNLVGAMPMDEPWTDSSVARQEEQMRVNVTPYNERVAAAARVENGEGSERDKHISEGIRLANVVEDKQQEVANKARRDVGEDAGFVDLIKSGNIGGAMELGLITAMESAPQMLAGHNPVGMVALGTLSAADEYDRLTKERPEMSESAKAAQAIFHGAIEQLWEQWGNPLKVGKAKVGGEITHQIEDWVKKDWRQKLKNAGKGIGEWAKEMTDEGMEEVMTDLSNMIFDTLLSAADKNAEGLIKEYQEQAAAAAQDGKELTKGQFAWDKARGLIDSFIGGAMAGGYMGAGSMAVNKAAGHRAKTRVENEDGTTRRMTRYEREMMRERAEVMNQVVSDIAEKSGLTRKEVLERMDKEREARRISSNEVERNSYGFLNRLNEGLADYSMRQSAQNGWMDISDSHAKAIDVPVYENGKTNTYRVVVDNLPLNDDGTIDTEQSGDIEVADLSAREYVQADGVRQSVLNRLNNSLRKESNGKPKEDSPVSEPATPQDDVHQSSTPGKPKRVSQQTIRIELDGKPVDVRYTVSKAVWNDDGSLNTEKSSKVLLFPNDPKGAYGATFGNRTEEAVEALQEALRKQQAEKAVEYKRAAQEKAISEQQGQASAIGTLEMAEEVTQSPQPAEETPQGEVHAENGETGIESAPKPYPTKEEGTPDFEQIGSDPDMSVASARDMGLDESVLIDNSVARINEEIATTQKSKKMSVLEQMARVDALEKEKARWENLRKKEENTENPTESLDNQKENSNFADEGGQQNDTGGIQEQDTGVRLEQGNGQTRDGVARGGYAESDTADSGQDMVGGDSLPASAITNQLDEQNSSIDNLLQAKGIRATQKKVVRVTAQSFHDAIAQGKVHNTMGWCVDVHDAADYENDICLLTEDGQAGIAITPDGDIVSLFSNGNGKGVANKLIPMAIAMGGRKADFYATPNRADFNNGLQNLYARFGAKVVAQTPFSEEFVRETNPEWVAYEERLVQEKIAEGLSEEEAREQAHAEAIDHPVGACIFPATAEEAIEFKAQNPQYTVDMDKVEKFEGENGYGDMMEHRDKELEKEKQQPKTEQKEEKPQKKQKTDLRGNDIVLLYSPTRQEYVWARKETDGNGNTKYYRVDTGRPFRANVDEGYKGEDGKWVFDKTYKTRQTVKTYQNPHGELKEFETTAYVNLTNKFGGNRIVYLKNGDTYTPYMLQSPFSLDELKNGKTASGRTIGQKIVLMPLQTYGNVVDGKQSATYRLYVENENGEKVPLTKGQENHTGSIEVQSPNGALETVLFENNKAGIRITLADILATPIYTQKRKKTVKDKNGVEHKEDTSGTTQTQVLTTIKLQLQKQFSKLRNDELVAAGDAEMAAKEIQTTLGKIVKGWNEMVEERGLDKLLDEYKDNLDLTTYNKTFSNPTEISLHIPQEGNTAALIKNIKVVMDLAGKLQEELELDDRTNDYLFEEGVYPQVNLDFVRIGSRNEIPTLKKKTTKTKDETATPEQQDKTGATEQKTTAYHIPNSDDIAKLDYLQDRIDRAEYDGMYDDYVEAIKKYNELYDTFDFSNTKDEERPQRAVEKSQQQFIADNMSFQRGGSPKRATTPAQRFVTNVLLKALGRIKGITVHRATQDDVTRVLERIKRKSSLDTEIVELFGSPLKVSVVSSEDGAKIQQNLETAKQKYQQNQNIANAVSDIGQALGAKQTGGSQYATIEAKNGDVVTIRISNHNATTSNFDKNGEGNGISIVISRKPNGGIKNDGNAHVTEFFYSDKKLHNADGSPIADIIDSLEQTLYSGEYKDATGLAEVDEVNRQDFIEAQIAYHGSGNKFSHFDHSHMGEGEGQQAYGWGTYVTQVKNIGKDYAVASAKQNDKTFLGFINRPGKRYLYTVEIPNNAYIPFEQQVGNYIATTINNALKKQFGINRAPIHSTDTGQKVYQYLVKGFATGKSSNAPRTASLFLSKLGFSGISYPANYRTGGRADGARNYVIFNENDLQIKDRVELMETPDGTVYGWAVGNEIYLTEDGLNPETPIHEYTHLWAKAMEDSDPKGWAKIVRLCKGNKALWESVQNDPNYTNIKDNDNRIASEVLSRYAGEHGMEKLVQEAERMAKDGKSFESDVESKLFVSRMKNALKSFWGWVKEKLGIENLDDISNRSLHDLLNGTDLGLEELGLTTEEKHIAEKAKADGTYMQAPNGKPSNLSPKQWLQTRTEAFKEWFGDWEDGSQNKGMLLDENGEPKVVYRGSADDDFVFRSRYGEGTYWFTDNREVAEHYARRGADHELPDYELDGRIQPVFLKLGDSSTYNAEGRNWENVYNEPVYQIVDDESGNVTAEFKTREEAKRYCEENGLDPEIEIYESNGVTGDIAAQQFADGKTGVVFENVVDGGSVPSNVYVVRDNGQAKSATENNGGFDEGNPDIRFQIESGEIGRIDEAVERRMKTLSDEYKVAQYDPKVKMPEKLGFLNRLAAATLDRTEGIRILLNRMDEVRQAMGLTKVNRDKYDVRALLEQSEAATAGRQKLLDDRQVKDLRKCLHVKGGLVEAVKRSKLYQRYKTEKYTDTNGNVKTQELTPEAFIDRYLIARDTIERMEMGIPPRGIAEFTQRMGVDMVTFVREVQDSFSIKQLTELHNCIKAITDVSIDALHDAGMLTDEQYAIYKSRKFYVPEKGFEAQNSEELSRNAWERFKDYVEDKVIGDKSQNFLPRGGKQSVRPLATSYRARGGDSMATDVMAHIIQDTYDAIEKAELNKVKRAMYDLLRENPEVPHALNLPVPKEVYYVKNEAGEWVRKSDGVTAEEKAEARAIMSQVHILEAEIAKTTDEQTKNALYDEIDALLEAMPYADEYTTKNVWQTRRDENLESVGVWVNGVLQEMRFPNMEQVANALNNRINTKGSLGVIRKVNGIIAGTCTQYNPSFFAVNLVRDIPFILAKGSSEYGYEFAARFGQELLRPTNQVAICQYLNGNLDESKGGIHQDFYDFITGGGQTGYARSKDIEELRKMVDGWKFIDKVGMRQLVEFAPKLNEWSELCTRFSAYRAALDCGMSKEEALKAAKNLSVNFNRRGFGGPICNALSSVSMFANATIQGACGFYRTFGGNVSSKKNSKGKRVARAITNFVAFPAIVGAILTWFTPDDDDKEKKIPDWERDNYICIGDSRFVLNEQMKPFYLIGVNAVLLAQGRRTWGQVVASMSKAIALNLLPVPPVVSQSINLGIEMMDGTRDDVRWETVMRNLWMPQGLQNFNAIAEGKDFMGRDLRKDYGDISEYRMGENEAIMYQDLAYIGYRLGEGREDMYSTYKKNGDKIDYNRNPKEIKNNIFFTLAPQGWVDIAQSVWGIGHAIAISDSVKESVRPKDIPIVNRFYKPTSVEMYRYGIYKQVRNELQEYKDRMSNAKRQAQGGNASAAMEIDKLNAEKLAKDVGMIEDVMKIYTQIDIYQQAKRNGMSEKELKKLLPEGMEGTDEERRACIQVMRQWLIDTKGVRAMMDDEGRIVIRTK